MAAWDWCKSLLPMRVLRAETLRQVCKESLADVRSLQLHGRGVEQLEGLALCPSLTSLNICRNALTELNEESFARCQELWIIDAAHNQLENIDGLSSFLAMGYLNLSYNVNLSLERLGPLARAHVLELYLGGEGSPASDRLCILQAVPNVWVLNGEYVTAHERRLVDHLDWCNNNNGSNYDGNQAKLLRWHMGSAKSTAIGSESLDETSGSRETRDRFEGEGRTQGYHRQKRTRRQDMFTAFHPEYRDMNRQGHLAREFFEDVVWKLPSRFEAADPIRLRTLLERYDRRAASTNRSAWLGSFTIVHGASVPGCGGGVGEADGGGSGCLPLSHATVLRSLPLESKLDIAVILAVRAAFRDTIPKQILAEALMVLLMNQTGVLDRIHGDLSCIPPFVCTALVHMLREDIAGEVKKVSAPGCTNTTVPPLLNKGQSDLLAALPPIVTGIGNAFEDWEKTQWATEHNKATAVMKDEDVYIAAKPSTPPGNFVRAPSTSEVPDDASIGAVNRDETGSERGSKHTRSVHLEGNECTGNTVLFDEEGPLLVRPRSENVAGSEYCNEAERLRDGTDMRKSVASPPMLPELLSAGSPTTERVEALHETTELDREGGRVTSNQGKLRVGVGLMRLCRRAVILLTRSPACPDLVERQAGSVDQRMYDQMEPLLAKAGMSYRDLHPGTTHVQMASKTVHEDANEVMPDTTGSGDSISADIPLVSSTPWRSPDFEDRLPEECGSRSVEELSATMTGSDEAAAQYNGKIRRPAVGEKVQVLRGTWSVIVSVCAEGSLVSVSPFQGVENSPHMGDQQLDFRCLYYDPRGWWTHIYAKQHNNVRPPAGRDQARLHRLHRGISASGLHSGAGSLNVPLLTCGPADELHDSRYHTQVDADPQNLPPACELGVEGYLGGPDDHARNWHGSTARHASYRAVECGRSSPARSLQIFRAEGSWDPVFVVAPARLVGLQNQAAVRAIGPRRARLAAWQHIDGPEVSVAPRPTMPRCWTSAPPPHSLSRRPVMIQSTSIPGLGVTSSSLPGISTTSSRKTVTTYRSLWAPYSALARSSSASSERNVSWEADEWGDENIRRWLELQREMGSLKADNQLEPSSPSVGGSRGGDASRGPVMLQAPKPLASLSIAESSEQHAEKETEKETEAIVHVLSSRLNRPALPWKGRPCVTTRRQTSDDTPIVFALTQLGVTPESDAEEPPSTSKSGGNGPPSVELPPPPETSPQDSPRAQARIDSRESLSCGSLRQRWQGRRRLRDLRSVSDTNHGMWRPNTRAALEWFPVRGRTVFRVDPNYLTTAAAAVTDAGDSKREGGAARSAGVLPASNSKERGTRCPPTVTYAVHASTHGIDQLSGKLDTAQHPRGCIQARANMWTPAGVRSAEIDRKGSGPLYTGLPRATDAERKVGGSINTEWGGGSSIRSRAKMARSNQGNGFTSNGCGSRISSKHSGASSWSTTTKFAGANVSPTSSVGVDGRVYASEHSAQQSQSSTLSPGDSLHRLSFKLRLRKTGSEDVSRSTRGNTAPTEAGLPNQRRGDHTPGRCSAQMRGGERVVVQRQNPPPIRRSSYSSNRRRGSSGKLRGRAAQRGRAPGGTSRSLTSRASNEYLQGRRAEFAGHRKNMKEAAGDASSVVSARLDNLSLHSELSYSSWNATPAGGVKGRTVL